MILLHLVVSPGTAVSPTTASSSSNAIARAGAGDGLGSGMNGLNAGVGDGDGGEDRTRLRRTLRREYEVRISAFRSCSAVDSVAKVGC